MRTLNDLTGFIFDLDGTLLDSLWVWSEVDEVFLSRRGLPILPDYAQSIAHLGFADAARYTIDRFGLAETPEQLMQEWYELARAAYRDRVPLKPHAEEFLRTLCAQSVHISAATSSEPELVLPCLDRLGITGLFDNITTIHEVNGDKSSPDIYLLAAERMQTAPNQCAVFEDILRGIQSAKSAGFYTVAVEEPASALDQTEIEHIADRYIRSFAELL